MDKRISKKFDAAYMICMHVQPQLWDTCNIYSWKCILYNQIKKAT